MTIAFENILVHSLVSRLAPALAALSVDHDLPSGLASRKIGHELGSFAKDSRDGPTGGRHEELRRHQRLQSGRNQKNRRQ